MAPSNLVAIPISASQIELQWHDNSDDETGFSIERRKGIIEQLEVVEQVGRNTIRFRHTLLEPNTKYFFRVQALRARETSGFSDIVETTTLANQGPWVELASKTDLAMKGVAMTATNSATVVGDRGTILNTNDAGKSWVNAFSRTEKTLASVRFLNSESGIVVGGSLPTFPLVLQTFNGGTDWVVRDITVLQDLLAGSLISEDLAIAVGTEGTVVKTADGGVTWSTRDSKTTSDLWGVDFISADVGFAVGKEGTILKTSDGGNFWEMQASRTSEDLYDICFADSTSIIAVGSNGTILRTMDGGMTWGIQAAATTLNLFGVSFTSPDTGTVVGEKGLILRTINGGSNWAQQRSGTTNTLLDVHFVNGDVGMAVGEYGTILLTTTGGDSN